MDFSKKITDWYLINKRDLPWRNTNDPYFIWLSEIILQQTRVDQGLSYYNKFIEHFPTINDLADAKEEIVMKNWQGLGYYNRARNMHYTAKHIANDLDGKFPTSYKEIIQLKGIGDYTASAISSFCFDEVQAVVDGNVYRLLSRYFAIDTPIDTSEGKKLFKELANELINKNKPGLYNQAIMEFGALQCKPKPNCNTCPLINSCIAYHKNMIKHLPVKSKKIKQKSRHFNFLVTTDGKYIYIEQRTKKDIWNKLYQFPNIETKAEANSLPDHDHLFKLDQLTIQSTDQIKHLLTHQKLYCKFWLLISKKELPNNKQFKKIPINELKTYPVPKVVENYIHNYPELFNSKSYL